MNSFVIDDFQDVSLVRSSNVWQHYLYSKGQNVSKCKYCGKLFKRDKKGSTTNLKTHLKNRHREIFDQSFTDTTPKSVRNESDLIGHHIEFDDI